MSRQVQITFDAHDPRALSSFWREALGYVHPGPPGVELPEGADPLAAWDEFLARIGVPEAERNARSAIEDPQGHGPRLFFQQVPEGKTAKNRVHLDLHPGEGQRDGKVAQLLELGATKLWDSQLGPQSWVTLADPEGNEFCVA